MYFNCSFLHLFVPAVNRLDAFISNGGKEVSAQDLEVLQISILHQANDPAHVRNRKI